MKRRRGKLGWKKEPKTLKAIRKVKQIWRIKDDNNK